MTGRYRRGPRLACDHIDDPDVFKAVCFALKMIQGGTFPNIANSRAAGYYGVSTSDVAFYSGQHAARISSSRRNRRKAEKEERAEEEREATERAEREARVAEERALQERLRAEAWERARPERDRLKLQEREERAAKTKREKEHLSLPRLNSIPPDQWSDTWVGKALRHRVTEAGTVLCQPWTPTTTVLRWHVLTDETIPACPKCFGCAP
jgi:hypothetical protein